MEYRANGTRFDDYYKWNNEKNNVYDYEKLGLLKHIMSNKIVASKNEMLMMIKDFFENSLVFMMKYVDVLKNFKNYHLKNR